MSRYQLWQATRDLMQGRRRDVEGREHGWVAGDWHEDDVVTSKPRECLNGAIALAEWQVNLHAVPRASNTYREAMTADGKELKRVLAETIVEQYPNYPGKSVPNVICVCGCAQNLRVVYDADVIAWFNDVIVGGDDAGGQGKMDAILDKVEGKLFESWWDDHESGWNELVAENEHLDELLPLVTVRKD